VEKDTRNTLLTIVAVIAAFAFVFMGIAIGSGNVLPQTTVVESESMQHGVGSQIGIIDTADMIILRNPDKAPIETYVDGYINNYQTFGSYGNVIIYSRGDGVNPVIHRAILWLDYNDATGTWSAPSLANYPSDRWTATSGADYNNLSGTLTLKSIVYISGSHDASIDLNSLAKNWPHSGYLTKGDNNSGFDQSTTLDGGGPYGLIQEERVKSVAWLEVPWVGVFRMWLNNNMKKVDSQVPNTVPSLAAAIFLIVFILYGLSFLFDQRYYNKYRKQLIEEMNAPSPPITVEKK